MTADDGDDLPVGIVIQNAGPGPARIKSVTYFVDKKPVGDVDKATDFENMDYIHFIQLEDGDTLAVGEKIWLLKYSKTQRGKQDDKELDQFLDIIDHHLAVGVEFCPVLGGDCGRKCSTKGWCE
jgi:inorganic pyrophosphatase/exopolyphosphatase